MTILCDNVARDNSARVCDNAVFDNVVCVRARAYPCVSCSVPKSSIEFA